MNKLNNINARYILEKDPESEAAQQEDLARQLLDLEITLKKLDTTSPHTELATKLLTNSLQELKDNVKTSEVASRGEGQDDNKDQLRTSIKSQLGQLKAILHDPASLQEFVSLVSAEHGRKAEADKLEYQASEIAQNSKNVPILGSFLGRLAQGAGVQSNSNSPIV